MNSFEQEFYRTSWQRVLPLGPHGIEPYLRTARARCRTDDRRRVTARLGTLVRDLSALGRRAAIALTGRFAVPAAAPRR